MSSEWKIAPLGEIARNVSRAFNFKNKDKVVFVNTGDVLNGDFLHFNKSNVKGLPGQAKKAIENKDILYSEIRPGNKRYVFVNDCFTNDIVVSTKFMVLEAKGPVIPEYLYLVLTSQECESEFKIIADSRSGTFPQITFDSVSHYPIKYPFKSIQKKIFEFDGALTGRIKINNDINQTLEEMAKALFKSWFVDFEPVKAKIAALEEGCSQEDATIAAMSAISGKDADTLAVFERERPEQHSELKATAELFPSAMQESELGAIPEGWRSGTVTNVTDKVFSGGTPTTSKSEYWNGEFKWFSSGETRNSVITNTEKTITKLGVEQSSTKESVLGDVLIASAGQGHTRGQTSLNMINTYINQSVVAVRPKNKIFTCWLYMNLRSRYEEMRAISDSHSSRGSLTTKLVSGMPVIIPSENILQKFEKSIFPLFDSVKHRQREIDSLTQLRDTLLPKLLSGEIALPEAEQAVSEAENV